MEARAFKASVVFLAVVFLTSCAHRMVGTWSVQRYENTTPGQQGVALHNIGTIQFNKNGSGEKNVSYTVLGTTHEDKTPFQWTWHEDKYVVIKSEASDFAKTWIIMTNKGKFQKWKATEGDHIQILELKK
ncbi:MAG: hypothetical protein JST43_10050 [Bacteroidetes bacterium]|nr:hypothetical protein [Bacteroidota bacterium]MBS1540432.1 hypothetical protein [Bacteroidota bacterium]